MIVVDYKKLEELLSAAVELDAKAKSLEVAIRAMEKFDIQEPKRIEAAIRELDKKHARGATNFRYGECANLLRYFLNQPQDTWKPEDFGLVPTKEGLKEEK